MSLPLPPQLLTITNGYQTEMFLTVFLVLLMKFLVTIYQGQMWNSRFSPSTAMEKMLLVQIG